MSNVTAFETAPAILQSFFLNCVGSHDGRNLVDVLITDSFIKELVPNQNPNQRPRTVDRHEARDINFIFDNGKFRTFRVMAKHWDKTLKLVKRMAHAVDGPYEFQKGESDPREQLIFPAIQSHFFAQRVVMQDLGVDLPTSVLFNEDKFITDLEGVFDGDLTAIEKDFATLAKILNSALQRVRANISVIMNDMDVKRDHNLYYSNFIDFKQNHIYASLTKMSWRMTGNTIQDTQITPVKLENLEAWNDIFSGVQSRTAIERLSKTFNEFNAFVDQKFNSDFGKPDLLESTIKGMFNGMWSQLMQMAEPIYTMDEKSLSTETDKAAEELLTEVGALEGKPGLDLNSWKAYDHTDADAPVFLKDFGIDLFAKYRNEFVDALYSNLLQSNHPLTKPYTVKSIITDPAEIAAVPIGSSRMERF